jgi:phosphoserine phosphatase RsbU/P
MIRLALLSLMTLRAFAQSELYIDLAGPWQMARQNAPEMARPDYDDRNWSTVQIPLKAERDLRGGPVGWLRRSVEIPEWADRRKLALTLGPLRRVYEVYVNGTRIAKVGNLQSGEKSLVPRTRSFPIPAEAAAGRGPIQIAIHFEGPIGGGRYLEIDQSAPYLITYRENAPVSEGERELLVQQAHFMPAVFFGTAYLLFGLFLLLAWWNQRESPELLWFAATLLFSAVNRWNSHFELLPQAHPFNSYGAPSMAIATSAVSWVCFASFVIEATRLRLRWLQGLLWVACTLWVIRAFGPAGLRLYIGMGVLTGAIGVLVLAIAWWKQGGQYSFSRHALFASLFLASAYRLWLNTLGDAQGYTSLGPYFLQTPDLISLVLTVAITGLLLNQIATERRHHQLLQVEMEAARQAQLFLLASEDSRHSADFRVEEVYEPALEVGGDFHWSRVEPDGSLSVVAGDVSGKGLKAALIVSVAIGILRNLPPARPSAILRALNTGLASRTGGGFVTCCCVRCGRDGVSSAASAGHPAPYVDAREIDLAAGLPLGLDAGTVYDEGRFVLAPGAQVTLVSDGVIESTNARGELFGFDRTREISAKSAAVIAEAARTWGQNDDITVVTVRRSA